MTTGNIQISAGPGRQWWFEGRHALLAEDNELAHELVRIILDRVGVTVDICMDGSEAVAAVQTHDYDVILMDIQMPDMDGMEATRRIRQLGGKYSTLPIIAMTANSNPEDIAMGREAGMNDHLGKPIDRLLLYQTLAKWFNADQPSPVTASTSEHTLEQGNELPQLSVIDTAEGLQRFADNYDVYMTTLRRFASSNADMGYVMESHLQNGDFEQAARLAHGIKGNSGNIGARKLHRCAADLEQACKQESMTDAIQYLALFQQALDEVLDSLRQLPAEPVSGQVTAESDTEGLCKLLAQNIELIDTDLGAVMDGIGQLKRYAGTSYRQQVESIEHSLNDFDTDKARQLMLALQNELYG